MGDLPKIISPEHSKGAAEEDDKVALRRRVFARRELKTILVGCELPTFPAVVLQALSLLAAPNVSLGHVGEVIAADPRVSAQLLSLTNSAAYALKREVQSVAHAVTLLGRREVESLLTAAAARGTLPRAPRPGFSPRRFWRASARRAATARAVADLLHPDTKSESFTAGLLQDMAIPVLSSVLLRRYGAVAAASCDTGEDLAGLEDQAFGWTHADAAGWLCRHWSFPERIADAIARHHEPPSRESPLPGAAVVSLISESEADPGMNRVIDMLHQQFDVPLERATSLVEMGFEQADETAKLFITAD